MLQELAGEARTLHTLLHTSPLLVLADHGQLEQVIVNLVANARDATGEGGLIRIGTTTVPLTTVDTQTGRVSTAQYARLTVNDNGAGMAPQIRERIFDPFFSTKDRGHGTGLGLYIARELCQANQASLDYVPVPAGGACFRIRLAGARAIATS